MQEARQRSPLVHDPLGLLALPIASIGRDRPADDGPRTRLLDVEERLGMANTAKTIGVALIAVIIAVSLVEPLGAIMCTTIVRRCDMYEGSSCFIRQAREKWTGARRGIRR